MARRKKQSEESQENQENINNESDDNFGLPEVEYEPIKREEPQAETETPPVEEEKVEEPYSSAEPVAEETEPVAEEEYVYTSTYESEESSPWPKILGVLVVLLLIGGAAWWWFGYEQPRRDEAAAKVKEEQRLRDEAATKKAEEERLAALQAEEQRKADSLAALSPAEGVIEALSERTGRYYVVVASAIDDDLIMDYAAKLSKKGVSTKIIPPFGKTKFSRIAVDVKDTYADAQSAADAMKGGDYGSEIWVVKY